MTLRPRAAAGALLLAAAAIGASGPRAGAQEPPAELTWSFEGLGHFPRQPSGCAPSVGLHGLAFVAETAAAGWSASACGVPSSGLAAATREGSGAWSTVIQDPVPAMHGRPAMTLSPQGDPFYVYAGAGPNDTYFIYEQNLFGGTPVRRMGIAQSQSSLSHPNISATFAAADMAPTFVWAAQTGFGGPLVLGSPGGDATIAAAATYSVDNAGRHVAVYANHAAGLGVYYSPGTAGDLRPVTTTTQSAGTSIAVDGSGPIYIASSGGRGANGVDDTRLLALSSFNGQTWDRTDIDLGATRNPSIAVDGFGNPAIAYMRGTELRLARKLAETWHHTLIASLPQGDGGAPPHLAFDAAARPHILFYDAGTRTITLARGEAATVARTLTVSTLGAGSGSVVSAPAGISCGTACQASFAPGQHVLLEAVAGPGSAFDGWGGACAGTGPCLVAMDAATSVLAAFVTTRPPIEVSPPGTGGCTLAQAIAAANADAPVGACAAGSGADVIHLPSGVYPLTAVDNTTSGLLTGLPIIASDITIVGDGAESTIIERAAGSPPFRLMRVFFTAGSRLTLDGVTMRGGHGGDSGGGAIYSNNPTVIRNSVFVDNHAGTSVGGAIRASSALTVAGSFFNGNQAPAGQGGAIYSTGTIALPLTVTTSKFEDNSALWGGAINYSTSAPHATAGLIANTIFHNNVAQLGGGAVIATAVTMARVTVTSNRVTAPGSGGGGLLVSASSILDSTIADNTVSGSGAGGGVLNSAGSLTITGTTIARNVARTGGGASVSGQAIITNVTFSGNRASSHGGGLALGGSQPVLRNVTIVENTSTGGYGGGLVSSGFTTPSIGHTVIAGNHATGELNDCYLDSYPIVSLGHNLIGNAYSQVFCEMTLAAGDQYGVAGAPIDPQLGPLADNGGATWTHQPAMTSPLVDAGSPSAPGSAPEACEAADQRGVERPQRAACDIGAVERANAAPIGVAQSITLDEDTTATIVLGATDADGDPVSFAIVESPLHGMLSGVAPNLTYTPFADFNGEDRFSFAGADSFDLTGVPDTVTITVTPTNDPPTTIGDVFQVIADAGATTLDVLANDSGAPDAEETLSITDVTVPDHGTAAISGAGTTVDYTPAAGFSGIASFSYTADDGHGASAPAHVVVAVIPSADLQLHAFAAPGSVNLGGAVTYTATVFNAGVGKAFNAAVAFHLPPSVPVLNAPSGCAGTSIVVCAIDDVFAGASAQVTLTVEALGSTSMSTRVTVQASTPDPQPSNNSVVLPTTIWPAADLALEISADPLAVNVGEPVTFVVGIHHRLGIDVASAVLDLTIPLGLLATPLAGCSLHGPTLVRCPLGPLSAGAHLTRTLTLEPQADGVLDVVAAVWAAEADPNPANNHAIAAAAVGKVIFVNSTGDAADTNAMDGVCGAGAGCTLRAAIETANALHGALIVLRIPVTDAGFANGVFTIRPRTSLPAIEAGVTLDASTQRRLTGNTNQAGPEVAIVGSDIPTTPGGMPVGLWIRGSDVTVRGFAIAGVRRDEACGGLWCGGAGVFVGVDPNTLGRLDNVVLEGNYLGTDGTGANLAPNAIGIALVSTHNATIGGSSASAGNVISGNLGSGVRGDLVSKTHIEGNLIAHNGGDGIELTSAVTGAALGPATVVGNRIYDNGDLGLDLGADGVTPNDASDVDIDPSVIRDDGVLFGGNTHQNFPVLSGAAAFDAGAAARVVVAGRLDTVANQTFRLNFYGNDACDPNGFGEGQLPIGGAGITSDAGGVAQFRIELSASLISGHAVTATATDAAGNTSEFSACAPVNGAGTADLRASVEVVPSPAAAGVTSSWRLTVANDGPAEATDLVATMSFFGSLSYFGMPEGCSRSGDLVTCTVASLAAGGSHTFAVSAAPQTVGAVMVTAQASAFAADPVPSNNALGLAVPVIAAVDLNVQIHAPTSAQASHPTTFVVRISNQSGVTATGVELVVALPADAAFFGTSAQCSRTAVTLTCVLGSLEVNHLVDIAVTIGPGGVGMLSLAAVVTSDQPDSDGDDNSALRNDTTVTAGDADLEVTLSDDGDPVRLTGAPPIYRIQVRNKGPAAATGVALSVFGPPTAELSGLWWSDGNCILGSGQERTGCPIGSLAVGEIVDLNISADPDAAGILTIQAVVTSDSPDPVASNDSSTETTVVKEVVDYAVHIRDGRVECVVHCGFVLDMSPVAIGVPREFWVTLQQVNEFQWLAGEATMTVTFPAGWHVDQLTLADYCMSSGTVFSCTRNEPHSADEFVFHFRVTPKSLGPFAVTASVIHDGTYIDPHPVNDTDQHDGTVVPSYSELELGTTLIKTDFPNRPLYAGESFVYEVEVANLGPQDAQNVVITDTLPNGLEFVSAALEGQETCPTLARTVVCTIDTLRVLIPVHLRVRVRAPAAGVYTNRVTVTAGSDIWDRQPEDRVGTVTHEVLPPAVVDLGLTIEPLTASPVLGDVVSYAVTVQNAGPAHAANLVVILSYEGAAPVVDPVARFAGDFSMYRCDPATATSVRCQLSIPEIPNGSSAALELSFRPSAAGVVVVGGSVSSYGIDSQPANNKAPIVTTTVYNTPAGANVVVAPLNTGTGGSPVTLAFANVTEAGMASLTIVPWAGEPSLTHGFSLGAPPLVYDISTTATFTGTVTVCIDYGLAAYNGFEPLRLLHFEHGTWVDRTSMHDPILHVVCGSVTSFSPFVVAQRLNRTPTADAGLDVVLTAASSAGTVVTLDGTGSTDPDDDALIYSWAWSGGSASLATVTATFPIGEHPVTLTVDDGHGHTASDSVIVTVTDGTPPTVTASVSGTLGSNGWYRGNVGVSWSVVDTDGAIGSAVGCGATTITSDTQSQTLICTATSAGGTATQSVSIKRDATNPALSVSGDIRAEASSPSGAEVNYVAPSATDATSGLANAPSCTPASGAIFAIGTTTVTCIAADRAGNTVSNTFLVTVSDDGEPGLMRGHGQVIAGNDKVEFEFSVRETARRREFGQVEIRIRQGRRGRYDDDRFESRSVTDVVFRNAPEFGPGRNPKTGIDTVVFRGTGKWDRRAGYSYVVTASDRGEPGRGRDSFTIEVRAANGQLVFSGGGALTDGNVQSTRLGRPWSWWHGRRR